LLEHNNENKITSYFILYDSGFFEEEYNENPEAFCIKYRSGEIQKDWLTGMNIPLDAKARLDESLIEEEVTYVDDTIIRCDFACSICSSTEIQYSPEIFMGSHKK